MADPVEQIPAVGGTQLQCVWTTCGTSSCLTSSRRSPVIFAGRVQVYRPWCDQRVHSLLPGGGCAPSWQSAAHGGHCGDYKYTTIKQWLLGHFRWRNISGQRSSTCRHPLAIRSRQKWWWDFTPANFYTELKNSGQPPRVNTKTPGAGGSCYCPFKSEQKLMLLSL